MRHRMARRRTRDVQDVRGWDLSVGAIELARERFPDHQFAVTDIHDAQNEGPFDVVVSVD